MAMGWIDKTGMFYSDRIKTVKGYINAVKRLDQNTVKYLKGYDKLTKEKQEYLYTLSAELGNFLGEFEDEM